MYTNSFSRPLQYIFLTARLFDPNPFEMSHIYWKLVGDFFFFSAHVWGRLSEHWGWPRGIQCPRDDSCVYGHGHDDEVTIMLYRGEKSEKKNCQPIHHTCVCVCMWMRVHRSRSTSHSVGLLAFNGPGPDLIVYFGLLCRAQ